VADARSSGIEAKPGKTVMATIDTTQLTTLQPADSYLVAIHDDGQIAILRCTAPTLRDGDHDAAADSFTREVLAFHEDHRGARVTLGLASGASIDVANTDDEHPATWPDWMADAFWQVRELVLMAHLVQVSRGMVQRCRRAARLPGATPDDRLALTITADAGAAGDPITPSEHAETCRILDRLGG
jgi:hypothetical protein